MFIGIYDGIYEKLWDNDWKWIGCPCQAAVRVAAPPPGRAHPESGDLEHTATHASDSRRHEGL